MKSFLAIAISGTMLSCPSLLLAQSNAKSSAPVKTEKGTEKRAAESQPASKTASAPVAMVDGQAISEDDLAPLVAGQLRPLRDQEYQIKKKALDTLIGQKIVEAEAKKKGLTSEQLLQQEVDAKVPDPSDVELNAVYALQREQLGKPFEEVKTQLAQNLKRAKIQQARQEYSAKLRGEAKVALLLTPPRTQVGFDPARVRGNAKAKVMIVEFSDFQCPYCGQVESTLKTVLAKHADTVALAFRDMPIAQIHPMAMGAAEAGRCAGEQGKFWEMHDLLFADQGGLDKNGLEGKARQLQLDTQRFDACLSGEKYKPQIQQDAQEGMRAGVTGTPGFFINGVFLGGAQSEATFERLIEEQLNQTSRP